MKSLAGVIAYNEEKSIARLIEELRRLAPRVDIVVIDNGSTDDTVAVAKSCGVPVVAHAVNTGSPYGTVMAYFLYADHGGYDAVCQVDGDGQHDPAHLEALLEQISAGADYVIGSRFIRREGYQSTPIRLVGIWYLSTILSLVIGQKITDPTSGFKAYSRRAIHYFARSYRKEIYDGIQMMLLTKFHGMKIVEVPVTMRGREHGTSEFNLYRSVVYPIKATLTMLSYFLTGVGR